MHSVHARPPDLPGPRSNLVPVWLIYAITIGYLVLIIALAVSLLVMAHTSRTDFASSQPRRCLSVDIAAASQLSPDHNRAAFYVTTSNQCGFPVQSIVLRYEVSQLACQGVGTGNGQGTVPIPGLAVGGYVTTRLSFSGYCIACAHGQVSGFPPFAEVVATTEARGFHGAQVAAMKAVSSASMVLLNDQHHQGPLSCSGNGRKVKTQPVSQNKQAGGRHNIAPGHIR